MLYKLSFFEDAKVDVIDAKAWYKHQQIGLDKRFAQSVKIAIQTLQKNPFAYAIRYKNIRIAHPKTFPFNIHFYVDAVLNEIVIIAIVHSHRNPNIVSERV